jgi:hypothetical protein
VNPCVINYEKTFQNLTIPRPLLIRLSYVARPIIAFTLKGDKLLIPIDGKSFQIDVAMDTKRSVTMCFRQVLS